MYTYDNHLFNPSTINIKIMDKDKSRQPLIHFLLINRWKKGDTYTERFLSHTRRYFASHLSQLVEATVVKVREKDAPFLPCHFLILVKTQDRFHQILMVPTVQNRCFTTWDVATPQLPISVRCSRRWSTCLQISLRFTRGVLQIDWWQWQSLRVMRVAAAVVTVRFLRCETTSIASTDVSNESNAFNEEIATTF